MKWWILKWGWEKEERERESDKVVVVVRLCLCLVLNGEEKGEGMRGTCEMGWAGWPNRAHEDLGRSG